MQKIAIYPKTKLPLGKGAKEILQIWEKARGIWKKKKIEPINYLKRTRKEWRRRDF